jgi:hypothetical protein
LSLSLIKKFISYGILHTFIREWEQEILLTSNLINRRKEQMSIGIVKESIKGHILLICRHKIQHTITTEILKKNPHKRLYYRTDDRNFRKCSGQKTQDDIQNQN